MVACKQKAPKHLEKIFEAEIQKSFALIFMELWLPNLVFRRYLHCLRWGEYIGHVWGIQCTRIYCTVKFRLMHYRKIR